MELNLETVLFEAAMGTNLTAMQLHRLAHEAAKDRDSVVRQLPAALAHLQSEARALQDVLEWLNSQHTDDETTESAPATS